jgi:hypothetical protein
MHPLNTLNWVKVKVYCVRGNEQIGNETELLALIRAGLE